MKKKWLFWLLAFVITLAAAIYQRTTGPTYSKEISYRLQGKKYTASLPRSNGPDSCRITLRLPQTAEASVHYKRYPTNEKWQGQPFTRQESLYTAALPPQPPAGKLQYFIEINTDQKRVYLARSEPIIIRFKGEVATGVLIPHVLLMFSAMLFSTAAGLFALGKMPQYKRYGIIALILIVLGGFIFGPIMQYQAFGDAWTGIPFGWDLTDNKTLVAFLGWLTAVLSNRKKYRPRDYVIAALLLLIVYSIPHSVMGSEYDYSKGEVTTGLIPFLF